MAAEELSEGEVSSLVQVAEGVLAELSSLDHSSDEEELVASVDELLEGATRPLCCQFARRVDEANVEGATTLLEIAYSPVNSVSTSKKNVFVFFVLIIF